MKTTPTTASASATAAPNAAPVKKKSNYTGSAILALTGMISRSWGNKATGRQIGAAITLEKNGMIRPVAERIETGMALTEKAFRRFTRLTASKDAKVAKSATAVIELANKLRQRNTDAANHKGATAFNEALETQLAV